MLAMHKDGLIVLPPPKWPRPPRRPMVFGPDTEPPAHPAPTSLDAVRPLDLRPAVRYSREGKLWNEFVARYHYLGYRTLGRRPDALRRPRPRRPAHRHARLQHRGAKARTPRPLHRMDNAVAREEPSARGRQPASLGVAFRLAILPPPREHLVGIDVVAPRHNRHRNPGLTALRDDLALLSLAPSPPPAIDQTATPPARLLPGNRHRPSVHLPLSGHLRGRPLPKRSAWPSTHRRNRRPTSDGCRASQAVSPAAGHDHATMANVLSEPVG